MPDQPEQYPGVFPGTLGTEPDIPRLLKASDLVCVGRVQQCREVGRVVYLVNGEPLEFQRLSATVAVERFIQGTADDQIEVELLGLDAPSGLVRIEEGERLLLFLQRGAGHFTLTDPVTGAVDLGQPHAEEVLARLESK